MPFTSNAIRYGTIVTISRAQELVKTCKYADECLADVIKHLGEDTMLTDKQKTVVTHHAINTREVLQKSMKLFGEVVRVWEQGCVSKQPPKKKEEF